MISLMIAIVREQHKEQQTEMPQEQQVKLV
jgi:hypothetical protein